MPKRFQYEAGIIFSAFDLLHAGYSIPLRWGLASCKKFYIGLHVDPSKENSKKNTPVQSVFDRWAILNVLPVHKIIPYETESDIENILKLYVFDCRILGNDYEDKDFTGRKYCEDNNIDLVFAARDHNYSTSALREKVYNAEKNRHNRR